jgi:hypothetical protein
MTCCAKRRPLPHGWPKRALKSPRLNGLLASLDRTQRLLDLLGL